MLSELPTGSNPQRHPTRCLLKRNMAPDQLELSQPPITAAINTNTAKPIPVRPTYQEGSAIMSKAKSRRGITMSKNVKVGLRTGSPSKATSPGAANQIGPSTAFKREQVEAGRAYGSGVKLGNEIASNVKGGGPGTGRTLYGQGGTNRQYGPVAGQRRPESRDILSQFGPEKSKG
jgi:hypothetical protein